MLILAGEKSQVEPRGYRVYKTRYPQLTPTLTRTNTTVSPQSLPQSHTHTNIPSLSLSYSISLSLCLTYSAPSSISYSAPSSNLTHSAHSRSKVHSFFPKTLWFYLKLVSQKLCIRYLWKLSKLFFISLFLIS